MEEVKSLLGNSGDERNQLGEVLANLALKRYTDTSSSTSRGRIEELIARRIETFSGVRDFGREEISEYLQGERWPEPEFIRAFAAAFSLRVKELRLVAWAYTFSEAPHPRIADRPPPVVD